MKYIKSYESYKSSNKDENMNEELIGGLFKSLFKKAKQNISLSYSKNFGTAKAADKIISEYQQKAIEAQKQKLAPLKALAEYIKNVKSGGNVDKEEQKKLQTNYQKQDELYKQRLEKIKQIYNAKLDDVVEDEENKKIKNYIKIKKLEMEEQLLLNEIKVVQEEVGMTDDQIKDNPFFKEIMNNLNKRATENSNQQKLEEEALKSEESNSGGKFDFEKAKNDKNYEGPYKDQKFGVGDEIKIYIREATPKDVKTLKTEGDKYEGTTAFVFAREEKDDENSLRVGYTAGAKETFTIGKGKVVSIKKLEAEEKPKEEKSEE